MSHLSAQALIADSFVFARENMAAAVMLGLPVLALTVVSSFVQADTQMVLATALMLLSTIAGVMLQTGLYRRALYGRAEPLQFRATEWRVLAASLLVMVFALLVLAVLAGSVLLTGVAGAIGAGAAPGDGRSVAGVIIAIILLVGVGFAVWLMVRLIAAIPATIDQGRVMVLQSLSITRGHFWPILAAVLVIILTAVLAALVAAALVLLAMLLGGVSVDGFASKDPKQAMDALAATPWTKGLYGVLNGALEVVIVTPLTVGLASSVYRRCAVATDAAAEPDVA